MFSLLNERILTFIFCIQIAALMYNPYVNYTLYRNPAYSRSGKLIQLSDFLVLANNASSVSGVLISIEVS